MDHFPRLRRNKKDATTPVQASHKADMSGKKTPPPGGLQPSAPSRPSQKLSPFRGFHLRSSHKRARDSPPASLPHSPATIAGADQDAATARPAPPYAPATENTGETTTTSGSSRPPKMPAFLELSEQEIESKFQELLWLERNRLLQSVQNQSPDFRWARVTGPHLKPLDRYMNIQPWNNNRVKLQVPHGHVDYINASPIALTPTAPQSSTTADASAQLDRYIAMQGPKQVSADHVWRMVVEQMESPGVIVMLTETHESSVEKCFQYFPRRKEDPPIEINSRDEFGDGFMATVRCEEIEETPAGDAIELRKLVVQVVSRGNRPTIGGSTNGTATGNGTATTATPEPMVRDQDLDVKMKSPTADVPPEGAAGLGSRYEDSREPDEAQRRNGGEAEERIIWHFLFKEWPDFGVPNLANLDNFFTLMRLSREKNSIPDNPRIVHCSAGVGRSGTFIALEHLIRELNAGAFEHCDDLHAAPMPPRSGSDFESDDGPDKGEEADDPIFNTVNQLREQRRTMVQAESQYLFIYQVMRKLWQDKYNDGEPAAKRLEVDPFVESSRQP